MFSRGIDRHSNGILVKGERNNSSRKFVQIHWETLVKFPNLAEGLGKIFQLYLLFIEYLQRTHSQRKM